LCTLASALLASRHPNHAEALLHHAEQALERLGPQAGLGPRTTAVGWEGWRLRTAGLVLDDLRSGARPLGQVLVSLWLGSLAVESLGHEVSPSALHALEEHLVCMVALRPAVEASMAEEDEHLVAMQSVLHGLLLLGGLRWLDSTGVLGPGALVDDLARADEVVRSGARTLELEALEAEDASLELALSSLAAAAELAGEQRMLPALLLALSSLEPEVQAVVPAVVLVRLVGL